MSDVPTTAKLPPTHSAISWWLAAGLVGADIGTSVFYSTGVLLPHVGFAAPFFILLVVLCMWLFKATYQEGTAVTPINGGAYTMMLQSLGRRSALIVGSLTIVSYLATAVVSALSGAYYLSSLWPEGSWPMWLLTLVASTPIFVFAGLNLIGLKESTIVVFGIAAFHFLMLIAMDLWGIGMLVIQGADWSRLSHGLVAIGPQGAILGFAAAFLGITGFESAAQIIEEIEQPSWQAMKKIYLTIVGLVSFTSPVTSALCLLLLTDEQIKAYSNNLLSGLAMVEGGRPLVILLVANACLTLFAAVNTAFAGATGLITTMGKQGNMPTVVLHRWIKHHPGLKGYPFVALPFAALCILMLIAFPGNVDNLGSVYGMAFLAVMVSYSLGVILLRLHQAHKVERSPYLAPTSLRFGNLTVPTRVVFKGKELPLAPILGGLLLLAAELILFLTAHDARALGIQLFLGVLLVMAFYRLGQVESRMIQLPDLRLGLGRFYQMDPLPEDLPVFVACTSGANAERLVTLISSLYRQNDSKPCEIILFHAEDTEGGGSGVVSGALERLVSQQLEEYFSEKIDIILGVKVLPGSLQEVLAEYQKARHIDRIYITSGRIKERSEEMRQYLQNELGLQVVMMDESTLSQAPGMRFKDWIAKRRRISRF